MGAADWARLTEAARAARAHAHAPYSRYAVGAALKTASGGRSWSTVPDLVAAGFGAGSPGNVTFISATQGWICAYGVGLWHTSDGVHWSALGI